MPGTGAGWAGTCARRSCERGARSCASRRIAGFPFAIEAGLRPFLLPPVPRVSILFGRPPDDNVPTAGQTP